MKKNLLLFNLRTDADDDVLGFTTAWINALAVHFETVSVITMSAGRLELAPNVTVHSLGREHGYSEARRAVRFYVFLWRILRERRIHACFAHMSPLFAVMGWPLLTLWRVPIVLWYAHGTIGCMLKLAVHCVRVVVSASRDSCRITSPKLRVIGHGIDTAIFSPAPLPTPPRPFTLVVVGRLSRIKRLDLVIEAVAIARRQIRDLRLVIIGGAASDADLPVITALKQQVERLDLGQTVQFVGPKPFREIARFYRTADAYANTSETRSVDKAALEAMAVGLPVLISNPAFTEILDKDLAAESVVPHDDPTALADGLCRLAAMSADERRSRGLRGRVIVEAHHGLRRLAGTITSLLINGPHG